MTTTNRRVFTLGAIVAALGLAAPESADARRRRLTKRQRAARRRQRNRAECGSQWRTNAQTPRLGPGSSYCFDKRDADLVFYRDGDVTRMAVFVPTCEGGITYPVAEDDDLRVTEGHYCLTVR